MNRNRKFILGVLTLVAMVLFVAVPVAAQAQRIYFEAVEYTCGVELGNEWITGDGKMQHIRGRILYDVIVSEEPRISGTAVAELDMNMNLATGDCTAWPGVRRSTRSRAAGGPSTFTGGAPISCMRGTA